jgi:hypothetical protein
MTLPCQLGKLSEHGIAGRIGVFAAPTPGKRRMRVPIGTHHQADIPQLTRDSVERGDLLVRKADDAMSDATELCSDSELEL